MEEIKLIFTILCWGLFCLTLNSSIYCIDFYVMVSECFAWRWTKLHLVGTAQSPTVLSVRVILLDCRPLSDGRVVAQHCCENNSRRKEGISFCRWSCSSITRQIFSHKCKSLTSTSRIPLKGTVKCEERNASHWVIFEIQIFSPMYYYESKATSIQSISELPHASLHMHPIPAKLSRRCCGTKQHALRWRRY